MNYKLLAILTTLCFLGCNSESEKVAYRDLNSNSKMDVYEDSTQSIDKRVDDLLSQMNLEEKAGLLFNSPVGLIGEPRLEEYQKEIDSLKVNHMGMPGLATAKEVLELNNVVQKLAENTRLGIPVTWYTDPRHGLRYNEAAGENRYHSWFPSDLGFAATRDANLVREFAEIGSEEYKALGIRLALHPMADLATEPRWFRNFNTFGEDAELAASMVKQHILGFQGEELGSESVICQVKHFPGAGPQKDGMDAHFASGKEQNYQGDNFDYHLIPFKKGAFAANVAQVMPYYGMPVGTKYEEVGFAYNKGIITDLLRNEMGFEGVVCTDWTLVTDNFAKPASAWGVEDLSAKERVQRILEAGVDMFGGENCPIHIIDLVNEGNLTEARLNESVRKVLKDKFSVGLFDNPYVMEDELVIFNNEANKEKGREAQRKSLTLLKNEGNILPLSTDKKVFLQGVNPKALEGFANVVATPEEADVILLKFKAPFTPVTDKSFLEKIFHQGRLDFPEEEKMKMLDLINSKPTISIMTVNRPAVIPEIDEASKALIADFECEDSILVELIFGKFKPTGKLPMEIPSSVEAVEAQFEDTPYDSKDPLYSFGHGLSYE